MMVDNEREKFDLDGFFDAAKAQNPEPSNALMARVMAQALEIQIENAPEIRVMPAPKPNNIWGAMLAAIGGWPAVTGLATATVAGVWIGFSATLGVGDAMVSVLASGQDVYVVDAFPGFDFDENEGDAG